MKRVCLILFMLIGCLGYSDSQYIYGIHWYGNGDSNDVEGMTGGKGIWSLETVCLYDGGWTINDQIANFQKITAKGHSIIIRIQPRWGWAIPGESDRAQYLLDVQTAASQAANFCHIWQIGNEMNLYAEYGGGVLTAADYIAYYKQIREKIKSVQSPLGEQIVLVGAVSPGAYYNEVRHTEGLTYLGQMCDNLTLSDCDGFAFHAYGAPWFDANGARSDLIGGYSSQCNLIDQKGFYDKPAFILEWNRQTNPPDNAAQEAESAKFIIGAFQDLQTWNNNPSNHPIVCAAWFIYPDYSGWENFSLLHLRALNTRGVNLDLWDSFQYACSLNIPAGSINPLAGVIVDNDMSAPSYTESGAWLNSASAGYNNGTYRFALAGENSSAVWRGALPQKRYYDVFAFYRSGTNRATSVKYTISTANGNQSVFINQQANGMIWSKLGTYYFNSGSNTVAIEAAASAPAGSAVIADAIYFKYSPQTTPTPIPSPTPTASPTPSPSQTPTKTPTPSPTPIPGANLLRNGDFEEGFTNNIGNYWKVWKGSWSNDVTFGQSTSIKHGGSYAQLWGRNDTLRIHGGICQAASVVAGKKYRLTAYLQFHAGNAETWCEFGYDLSGQTSDGEASSIIYTKLESGGQDKWLKYEAEIIASGNSVSVFAKGGQYSESASQTLFYADDISLTDAPIPSPTITPTPTVSPSPIPTKTPSPTPSPTPTPSPSLSPTPTPSPSSTPTPTPIPTPTSVPHSNNPNTIIFY